MSSEVGYGNLGRLVAHGAFVGVLVVSTSIGAQYNPFTRSIDPSRATNTAVSGRSGSSRAVSERNALIRGVLYRNTQGKTCELKVSLGTTTSYDESIVPSSCPLPTSGVEVEHVEAPYGTFVTGIEVCLPAGADTTSNDRISGVRIRVASVAADGSVVPRSSPESAVSSDCSSWQTRVDCPADQLAVNVLGQLQTGGSFRGGLALACAPLTTRARTRPGAESTVSLDLDTRVPGTRFTAPSGATSRSITVDGVIQSLVTAYDSSRRLCALQAAYRTVVRGETEGQPILSTDIIRVGACADPNQAVVWKSDEPSSRNTNDLYRIGVGVWLPSIAEPFTVGASGSGSANIPPDSLAALSLFTQSYDGTLSTGICPSDHVMTGIRSYAVGDAITAVNAICSPIRRGAPRTPGSAVIQSGPVNPPGAGMR